MCYRNQSAHKQLHTVLQVTIRICSIIRKNQCCNHHNQHYIHHHHHYYNSMLLHMQLVMMHHVKMTNKVNITWAGEDNDNESVVLVVLIPKFNLITQVTQVYVAHIVSMLRRKMHLTNVQVMSVTVIHLLTHLFLIFCQVMIVCSRPCRNMRIILRPLI